MEEQPSGRGRVEAAGRQDGELEQSGLPQFLHGRGGFALTVERRVELLALVQARHTAVMNAGRARLSLFILRHANSWILVPLQKVQSA